MREARGEPTTRFVGVITVVFWASAALMTVAALLSWGAPALREVLSFSLLGGTCAA